MSHEEGANQLYLQEDSDRKEIDSKSFSWLCEHTTIKKLGSTKSFCVVRYLKISF